MKSQFIVVKKGVIFDFCIEPLGKNYTDFIISNEEGGEIVKKIDSEHFKLHLDTKTFFYKRRSNVNCRKVSKFYTACTCK